jgi:predicted alpha/beta-hydrolase family hydrolase
MGGRMASMVADELAAAGLVCLGYPFHPPGRPERLRTAHLEDLRTPALVVQGTRDPFGTEDDVRAYRLSDAIAMHWLQGGNHDLRAPGRTRAESWTEAASAASAFVKGQY